VEFGSTTALFERFGSNAYESVQYLTLNKYSKL